MTWNEAQIAEWRAQWAREDEMLQFFDAEPGWNRKALSQKFDLPYPRVVLLVRKHKQQKETAALHALVEESRADTFEMKAERLWLDLAWLIMALEKRGHGRGARAGNGGR